MHDARYDATPYWLSKQSVQVFLPTFRPWLPRITRKNNVQSSPVPFLFHSTPPYHHHSPNHYHESLSETNRRQAEAAVNGAVTYNKLKAGASVKHRKWPTATCFDSFAFAFFISVSIRCKCLMCSVVRQNKIEIQMLRIGICIGQKNCFDKQETNDLNKI